MTKNQNIAAVVLAAGKGSRMKSPLPKVMSKIAGRTMVHHVLASVVELGAKKIVGVISNGATSVSAEFERVAQGSSCVVQHEQLGTGHAVQQAVPELNSHDGVVLVLYGDTPFVKPETLSRMVSHFDTDNVAVCVLGFTPDDAGAYGRLVVDNAGDLHAIVEYKDANDEQRAIKRCNSGVMAIRSSEIESLLDAVGNDNANGEYYLTDIVSIARTRDMRCVIEMCDEQEVMGVNSQAERAIAENIKQQELRTEMLAKGVALIAPETVFLQSDTLLAPGVLVHPNVVFGPGVDVHEGVEIKSFSHLEGCVLRANSTVGPYARMRPGADIGEDAKIGNFVEIKKSTLGTGAKVSHLSYIGDAEVGADVNIGAGTITCNYDGYNKAKTVIGEGAFVGSNSSLVAPVEIGKGAIVAAGSTVIKNVTSDAVVRNIMPQEEVLGRAKEIRDTNS
jgi:bifunctional UDP-N-acetylglucosamine pyrophosphorylase/glucosamine-1-phosphate N-acetyltransferase